MGNLLVANSFVFEPAKDCIMKEYKRNMADWWQANSANSAGAAGVAEVFAERNGVATMADLENTAGARNAGGRRVRNRHDRQDG